jgi:hypothetical protein
LIADQKLHKIGQREDWVQISAFIENELARQLQCFDPARKDMLLYEYKKIKNIDRRMQSGRQLYQIH